MRTLALTLLLLAFAGCVEERSPRDVVADVSGLEIPRAHQVVEHQEQWNEFNGDGEAWIVLAFDKRNFDALVTRAQAEGYLPIRQEDPEYQMLLKRTRGVSEGLYRYKYSANRINYELTVLDARTQRIIIRIVES